MNIDQKEISKFDAMASKWWDPQGVCKPLHIINPARLAFIQEHTSLKNKKIIDIGCGGGILTESLARQEAIVTGIDLSEAALHAAKEHAQQQQLTIDYRHISAEELAIQEPGRYDIVTCMELLEHVPDPLSLIQACAALAKEDGLVFFSTINRTLKAYAFAILGAEYVLKLLPAGTHDYAKFIRPSELGEWLRTADLNLLSIKGLNYQPFAQDCRLDANVDVNYIVAANKPYAF